jgi:hypothetical protein
MGRNKVEIKDGNPITTWEVHRKKTEATNGLQIIYIEHMCI